MNAIKSRRFILGLVFLIALNPVNGFANEANAQADKKGFQLGFELNGLTDTGFNYGAAKVDLIAGYRFNPYFSLNLDAWTVYLLAYGIELNPRIHFPTDSKLSPYLGVSAGWMYLGFFETLAEDIIGDDVQFLTFTAGPGLDIGLSKRTTLNLAAKYRGVASIGAVSGYGHGVEGGLGFRWRF